MLNLVKEKFSKAGKVELSNACEFLVTKAKSFQSHGHRVEIAYLS
jgi:hypothetical protein